MADVVGSDGWSWKMAYGHKFVIPHLQRVGKEGPVTESLYIYILQHILLYTPGSPRTRRSFFGDPIFWIFLYFSRSNIYDPVETLGAHWKNHRAPQKSWVFVLHRSLRSSGANGIAPFCYVAWCIVTQQLDVRFAWCASSFCSVQLQRVTSTVL